MGLVNLSCFHPLPTRTTLDFKGQPLFEAENTPNRILLFIQKVIPTWPPMPLKIVKFFDIRVTRRLTALRLVQRKLAIVTKRRPEPRYMNRTEPGRVSLLNV